MTIEELKAEWEDSRSPGPDCSDSEFAQKYMDKLLAVAEASEPMRKYCLDQELNNPLLHRVVRNYDKALADLLE